MFAFLIRFVKGMCILYLCFPIFMLQSHLQRRVKAVKLFKKWDCRAYLTLYLIANNDSIWMNEFTWGKFPFMLTINLMIKFLRTMDDYKWNEIYRVQKVYFLFSFRCWLKFLLLFPKSKASFSVNWYIFGYFIDFIGIYKKKLK